MRYVTEYLYLIYKILSNILGKFFFHYYNVVLSQLNLTIFFLTYSLLVNS